MAKTVASSASAYASGADLILRFDPRYIADWVSVNDQRYAASNGTVNETTLASHPKITAALKSASGYIEAIAVNGGRYTAADLAALAASSTNGAEMLKDITCVVAARSIAGHRLGRDEYLEQKIEEIQELLRHLAAGVAIFPFAEAADAAILESEQMTPTEFDERYSTTTQYEGYLGRASDKTINPYG